MPPLSRQERRDLLANTPLFSSLSGMELDGLVEAARPQSVKVREEIFHKGDESLQVYLIASGSLKALTTSADGDDVVFSILGEGELIGEIGLLGGTTRTATVIAITPAELLVIDRRDFLSFLKRHPEASIKLMGVLASRLKRVSELVEDTLFLNLPVRLAKKIVNYADTYGEQTPEGLRIMLKLSQEEWGDLVGATRESVNKQLRSWFDQGLISTDHGYILIHRFEELEELAGCMIS